jgi:hypothetical protein
MPVVELVQMKGPWGKTKSLGGEVAQRGRGDSTGQHLQGTLSCALRSENKVFPSEFLIHAA